MDSKIYMFISGRKPRHLREFLNALCFPKGAQIVVAYSHKWLPEHLRDVTKLKNKICLISFCELQSDEVSKTKVHPARWATIANCVQESSGFSFTLRLGEFQNYDKAEAAREGMVDNFQKKIAEIDRSPASPSKDHQPYYVIESSKWDGQEYSGNWVASVEHFRKLYALKECQFFQLYKPDLKRKLFPFNRKETASAETMELPASSSHEISLQVINGPDTPFKYPKIEFANSVCQVLGPMVQQFSEGELCSYRLDFAPQLQRQSSFIRVYSELPSLRSPSFDAIVTVRPNRVLLLLILLCISAAPVVATMKDIPIFQNSIFEAVVPMRALAFILSYCAFMMAFRRFKVA